MSKIWLLTSTRSRIIYDCAQGFVVIAEDEAQARQLASQQAGDEGAGCWLAEASCLHIGEALPHLGSPDVVLRDFLAG